MPQFDVSFYFSQFFWLIVCFSIILFVVKKISIPRMNLTISKRDEYISKYSRTVDFLEKEIDNVKYKIAREQKRQEDMFNGLIKKANKELDLTIDMQTRAIQEENEMLINGMRVRLNTELRNIESIFKIYIEDIAKTILGNIIS